MVYYIDFCRKQGPVLNKTKKIFGGGNNRSLNLAIIFTSGIHHSLGKFTISMSAFRSDFKSAIHIMLYIVMFKDFSYANAAFSHSATIIAQWDFFHLKNNWHFEKMSATVFTTVAVFIKNSSNCQSITVSQFPVHNSANCEILTIVAILWLKTATFVTAWHYKCNWINLLSMGALRTFRKWTTNGLTTIFW